MRFNFAYKRLIERSHNIFPIKTFARPSLKSDSRVNLGVKGYISTETVVLRRWKSITG